MKPPINKHLTDAPLSPQDEILIIDDSVASLQLLAQVLTDAGYRVRLATNGALALRSLAVRSADLILLDVKMPHEDGYMVCRQLKREHRTADIPVIFISALEEVDDKIKGFEVGGVDYITKPFQAQEVLARVRIQLRLRRMQLDLARAKEKVEEQVRRRTIALEHANQALQKSEEKFRALFESSPDIVGLTDLSGTLLEINKVAPGYRKEQVIGSNVADYLCVEDKTAFEHAVKAAIRTGQPSSYEPVITSPDGKVIYWHNRVSAFGTGAKVDRLVINFTDITDRKKAESEKIALERQLRQSQKLEAIGNLAGGIAHDFNNILSAIIGFTELMLDDVEEKSDIAESLQEVYAAGKRAKELVTQILAFARQSDEQIKPVQPGVVIKEVLKFIRSSIPATIEIQQEITSHALVMGNATQFHQVFMNLCTNAAYAMEEKGGILAVKVMEVVLDAGDIETFSPLTPGNHLRIDISDTGVGIAPEIIESVFEPYFTTKDPGEGTGMGLAVVHGIIETYGGRIMVDSHLGKGTTFTIFLPVTANRKPRRSYKSEALPSGTERILFVDDEAQIARMSARILSGLGYLVTTRTNSTEAVALFRSEPEKFDLVITDMTMPDLTGDQLAAELIRIRPDIPVILCTGYSKKITNKAASEIGVRAIAAKPIVKADLAKTVRTVLDGAKAQIKAQSPAI